MFVLPVSRLYYFDDVIFSGNEDFKLCVILFGVNSFKKVTLRIIESSYQGVFVVNEKSLGVVGEDIFRISGLYSKDSDAFVDTIRKLCDNNGNCISPYKDNSIQDKLLQLFLCNKNAIQNPSNPN